MGKVIKDEKIAQEMWEHAQDLKATYAQRDADFKEYQRMYLMKWPDNLYTVPDPAVKPTISPTARDKVDGAVRLLLSQQPIFHVNSFSTNDKDKIESIETSLSRWWEQAGVINRRPIHYNMMLSMVLYDETHTAITPIRDYAEKNKKDKRIKRFAEKTPILFESWNPMNGYPEFDTFGLCFYYRESQDSWSNVMRKYKDILGEKYGYYSNKRYGNATISIAYDLDYFAVWIDRDNILLEEHELPAIPIDVTFGNGSNFFEKPEDQRQPMLYSLLRSKLWDRYNMLLTVIYTQMFALGLTPIMVYRSASGDPLDLQMDNSHGYSLATLKQNESLDIITNKGILPQEMKNVLDQTKDLIDSSTIYGTAFGEKYPGTMTFSEASLLAQSARLPLIAPQRMGGFGISSVIELALMTMKDNGISFNKNGININAKDIPDDIEVKVSLDVVLPHERLQNITVAKTLVDSGFSSMEWAQNNVLGITNTEQMKKNVLEDQISKTLVQQELQNLLTKLAKQQQAEEQAREQAKQQIQQQAQMPPEQVPAEQPMPEQPMPEQTPPPTGEQLAQEAVNQLYQNAMPRVMPDQFQDIAKMGLPPQMGGMVPGQTGLNGIPEELL